jgi:hypothetical protein
VQSSFSLTYTQSYLVEDGYDDNTANDQTPISASIVPDRQADLINHYMLNVLKIQYLLADRSISTVIYNFTQTSPSARDAVCLLSSLHRHSVRDNNALFSNAMSVSLVNTALPYEAHPNVFYERLRLSLLSKSSYDEGEAMACLHVVSSFLFSGGRGDWDVYLDIASKYVMYALEDPNYYSPEDVLRHCPETTRFIVKTTSEQLVFCSDEPKGVYICGCYSVVRRARVCNSETGTSFHGLLSKCVWTKKCFHRGRFVYGVVHAADHGM